MRKPMRVGMPLIINAPKYPSGVDWNLRDSLHALMRNHLHDMLSKDLYKLMLKCL